MESEMILKQNQFNYAMKLYETKPVYQNFNKIVSIINMLLQITLAFFIFQEKISLVWHIIVFFIAFYMTDFINGLVHMYMDNNENYNSIWGPFIASFHLHHKTPLYKKNPILLVYFNESGSKIWLAIFQILFVIGYFIIKINPVLAYGVIYFIILSCIAEVSHYSCHVSESKLGEFLRKIGFLMNKKHHAKHHLQDNVNYAFLSGISDTLINVIAKKYYGGYKNSTDKHYENYSGSGTKNR